MEQLLDLVLFFILFDFYKSEGGIARQRDPLDRNNHIYVGVLADLWTLLSKSMNFT